jgi:hypothetical protein
LEDAIPDAEKARRLEVIMGRQREIQIDRYKKYVGATVEVMVEGVNAARGQWIGRTSQNKTLNFAAGGGVAESTATSKPRSKATDKPALGGAEGSVRPTQATSTATDQSVCPAQPVVGSYCSVRVTASFPNSLVGEMI